MLVTLVALVAVVLAARGGDDSDRVAAGDTAGSTVTSTTVATTTTAVRVIELAEPVPDADDSATSSTVPTTVATTAPPTTVKATTTAKAKPTTTVTTLPSTTVLDTAPPATAPPSTVLVEGGVAAATNVQEGRGTFHRYDNSDPQWGERPCAHRTLPKGTVVTVVNTKTGASTWCIVKDRGPYGNAIIDLDEEQFVEIAPVAAGVINVRITW